jgi:hypothetical protein
MGPHMALNDGNLLMRHHAQYTGYNIVSETPRLNYDQ